MLVYFCVIKKNCIHHLYLKHKYLMIVNKTLITSTLCKANQNITICLFHFISLIIPYIKTTSIEKNSIFFILFV